MGRRIEAIFLMGLAAVLFSAIPAQACGYGMPDPFARFTAAECVIVGKVLGFDGQFVSASASPNAKNKLQYAVADVEIVQALKGAEGLTHVRVGFLPGENLQVDQVGCFFLNPHFSEPFYLMPHRFGLVSLRDNNPAFENELKQYERWGNLLRDPNASLQSDNAEDRFLTVALLVSAYRTFQPEVHMASSKVAPIDPQLSKLLLLAIAEVDWNKAGKNLETTPAYLFNKLGITAKEGWSSQGIKSPKDYEDAAKKWLKNNLDRYQIKAYVRI